MADWRIAWAIAAAAIAAAPACGDDSTAELGAGGIVFTNNTPLQMAEEDLYVSPKAVRVHFVFVNPGNRDVETVVAFPLPDIDTTEFHFSGIGSIVDDPVNFVGFRAVVDGRPVALATEQRAFSGKREVTAQLLAAGAPLNPIGRVSQAKLDHLPAAALAQLKTAGLIDTDNDDIVPRWTVRTRFYWTQKFPAHARVSIDHAYQPVTGGSFFNRDNLRPDDPDRKRYCIDPATAAAMAAKSDRARAAKPDNNGYLASYWTDYILMTANNWNGPIGRFHLTLDKLKPDNLVSLCWSGGLSKTGPTSFETVRNAFAPSQDIHLLVLDDIAD